MTQPNPGNTGHAAPTIQPNRIVIRHTTAPAKHDIHKSRDIRPKLRNDNWISWKRELLATARDQGLHGTITGRDIMPTKLNTSSISTRNTPIVQLINKWDDRNNIAYNQILLCISPELQTAINDTEEAAKAWQILTNKFESNDPSKISIVHTKYENYHMTEGQSVSSYLTTMKEFKNQLGRMGEPIAPSTHAATILRNLPES